jgi:4-oxalocrotonate tautomerase
MPEIIVYAVEGRSPEQKRGLMKDITEAVVRNFGVVAEAVVVQIVEAPKTHKMKGGQLYSERMPGKPPN